MRDISQKIGDTAILGVSPDPLKKQRAFDEKYDLGFPLLADVKNEMAEAWGVRGEKKMYGNTFLGTIRSSFLIGSDGLVEEAWYKISPKDTPKKLLEALGIAE